MFGKMLFQFKELSRADDIPCAVSDEEDTSVVHLGACSGLRGLGSSDRVFSLNNSRAGKTFLDEGCQR